MGLEILAPMTRYLVGSQVIWKGVSEIEWVGSVSLQTALCHVPLVSSRSTWVTKPL